MPEEIGKKPISISRLAQNPGSKEITPAQGAFNLDIDKETDINGIGMGVLSDGTPYLNQRGLATLCGVQNAHIGAISREWNEPELKPRIRAIKDTLTKMGVFYAAAHVEIPHRGTPTTVIQPMFA